MRHLFVTNPMLAELARERSKALAEHNWRGGQLAARILLLVVYLFLLVLTLRWVEYVEPYVVLYVMLALEVILIPAALHGSIAGEREKRSLDMLLVAPVTVGQIVVGKASKAFLSIAALVLAIGVPALIIELVKDSSSTVRTDQAISGMLGYMYGLLLCIAVGMGIAGLTMWISSKTKSTSASLLSNVAAMFILFIVTLLIGQTAGDLFPGLSAILIYMNPFVQLYWAYTGHTQEPVSWRSDVPPAPHVYYWPLILVSLAGCALFLFLASENLRNIARGRQ